MSRSLKIILKIAAALVIAAILVGLFVYSQRLYLKKAYPIKYTEIVEKYSEEYELDPHFVYAIMRTESDFTPSAQSSVGARGLMQVTEATFNWVKSRLKDNESTFDSMYDAETSVKYGVYLLSYLKNTLGSEQNILCGYHAGVNRAKGWLSDLEISQNGEIIVEKIPYPDTKQYVQKVMKTYNIYKKLY
ncbi:MAG: lytic transglycosylase domain-containing protein [Ruminococcaceae bacterium]|nr:lytic transglycosylase domain-containing protein [Oscillospiraceae bacterium]